MNLCVDADATASETVFCTELEKKIALFLVCYVMNIFVIIRLSLYKVSIRMWYGYVST